MAVIDAGGNLVTGSSERNIAFLVSLGVNEKTAAEDACKIEHDLSEETFEKIKAHAESHSGTFF